MIAHGVDLLINVLIGDGFNDFFRLKIFIFAELGLRIRRESQREDKIFALFIRDDISFIFGNGAQI